MQHPAIYETTILTLGPLLIALFYWFVCSLTAEEHLQVTMFGSCLAYSSVCLHVYTFLCTSSCVHLPVYTFLCTSSCGYHIQYFSVYVYTYIPCQSQTLTTHMHCTHLTLSQAACQCILQASLLAHLCHVQLLYAHSVLRIRNLFASDGQPPCMPLPCPAILNR